MNAVRKLNILLGGVVLVLVLGIADRLRTHSGEDPDEAMTPEATRDTPPTTQSGFRSGRPLTGPTNRDPGTEQLKERRANAAMPHADTQRSAGQNDPASLLAQPATGFSDLGENAELVEAGDDPEDPYDFTASSPRYSRLSS